MDKIISYCGIACTNCPAYIATQNDDDEARKETAQMWSKQYNAEIKPEHINCDGCVTKSDRHIEHWNTCEFRKCASSKEVENCAHCDEYACEMLSKFFEMVPDAKKTLEEIRKTL